MNKIFKKVTGSIILGVFVITAGGYSASAQEEEPRSGYGQREKRDNYRMLKNKAILGDAQKSQLVGDKEASKIFLGDEEARYKNTYNLRDVKNIPEEDRATIQEARDLREAGDKEAAKALLDANEITSPREEMRENRAENKEIIDQARELKREGENEAAKELLKESGIKLIPNRIKGKESSRMQNLTEEQVVVLEEAQALRESGDIEAAKILLDEAGIDQKPKKGLRSTSLRQNLTEEQVIVLEEAKVLRESGDREGAKNLMKESGVVPQQRAQQKAEIRAVKEEAKVLRESGDVQGARTLIRESILAEKLDRGAKNSLSEDQKAILEEAKVLRETGYGDEARELIKDSGIELKKPKFNKEIRQSAVDAVSSGDYEAWASIASETKFSDKNEVSEVSFDALAEAKILYDSGEARAAKNLLEDAGFQFSFWQGASKYLGR